MDNQEIPIACNLDALIDREDHQNTSAALMAQALSLTTLSDGYQIEFPISTLQLAAKFIDGERLCCPFLQFDLIVLPQAQKVQLQLTGSDDVKAFLTNEIVPMLSETITK